MTGATIPAARNPAMKSDVSRSPRFFVFHTLGPALACAISGPFGVGNTPCGFGGELELGVKDAFGSIFGMDMDMSTPGIEGLMDRARILVKSNLR